MNEILYNNRCKCNEKSSKKKPKKKRKIPIRSEGKPLPYPESNEIKLKTFQIKYEKSLSLTAKLILNSFQNKYIYYAMDDILYTLKSDLNERDSLLAILYSSIISLQNNLSVNFFDIWISEIYIEEISKANTNRFFSDNSKFSKKFSFITIKLLYKIKVPVKKQESLW